MKEKETQTANGLDCAHIIDDDIKKAVNALQDVKPKGFLMYYCPYVVIRKSRVYFSEGTLRELQDSGIEYVRVYYHKDNEAIKLEKTEKGDNMGFKVEEIRLPKVIKSGNYALLKEIVLEGKDEAKIVLYIVVKD